MKTLLFKGAVLSSVWLAIVPTRAHAYSIENSLADGCHERITSEALRTVRRELATAGPLPATEDEQALIDDVQFTPDADMTDLGGTTLLISVRDNDLKGRGAMDLSQLAEVHGDPANQEEHCLRNLDQKEPGGSAAAVASCRAFIRGRVMEALAGLDASGKPDLGKRTVLGVHLALRNHVDAPLPTYYVKMGQAIHAVQDSFTHTYRTADEMKITVVLNWIDDVNGTLVESRDGPAHATALDRCDDPDDLRKTRRLLAIAASTEILRATLDPQKTVEQKLAAVDAVLDSYVGYAPGCTFENAWCDAPESQYKNPSGCACATAGPSGPLSMVLPGAALAGFAIARRRRRRKTPVGAALALALLLVLGVGSARAQSDAGPGPGTPTTKTITTPAKPATPKSPAKPPTTTTTTTTPGETPSAPATTVEKKVTPTTTTTTVTSPTEPDTHRPPPPTVVPVAEPGPRDVSAIAWGGYLGGSGALDNPALAVALGVRLRVTSHWIFGLDGEWNPWIGHGSAVKPGVTNLYATAMYQLPLAYESFNLRSSVSLGGSYLLMTLYGAPKGSLGIYTDVSFLGLAWKASRAFYLIINPMNISIPIPQLKGVPLTYPQYRLTVGIEMYLG